MQKYNYFLMPQMLIYFFLKIFKKFYFEIKLKKQKTHQMPILLGLFDNLIKNPILFKA